MVRSIAFVFGLVLTIYAGLVLAYRVSATSEAIPNFQVVERLDPYEDARLYGDMVDTWIEAKDFQVPLSARSIQLFHEAPLDTRLFEANVIYALNAGSFTNAETLADHLLDLDARHSIALLARLNDDMLNGDHAGAVKNLDRLMVVNGEQRSIYFDIASALYIEDDSRSAIQDALTREPDWAANFIARLIELNPADASMLAMVKPHTKLHSQFVRSFVRSSDIASARQVFLDLLSDTERDSLGLVYNPNFEPRTGARPFNWSLTGQFADIESRGGLAVTYFGQNRPRIASQIVQLEPGSYRLRTIISGSQVEFGGHLSWVVTCFDAKESLAVYEILELTELPAELAFEFEVPASDCAFQTLTLQGVAGTFPRALRAKIESVTIEALAL
ncbi:MAG: hypothetical protein QNI84_13030 [Henriciella sp.]|nr:hypothetical protein [Henriciella sp.]